MIMRIRHLLAICLVLLTGICSAHAEEPAQGEPTRNSEEVQENPLTIETDHGITFLAIVLTHKALRNSKELHDWPFFSFAIPAAWNSAIKANKDINKLLSFKGAAGGALSFAGLTLSTEANLELIHLLEFGIQGTLGSSINYGDYATFMGVFDPEKRDYNPDMFMTEFTYAVKYKASLTIPLLVFLPKSNWTKFILKPNASLTYSAYTGAEDGEVWKAGSDNMVNGFKYSYGGVLIYLLPFERVPMAMVSVNASGFKHDYDFDKIYADYDPGFVTVSVTPMLNINLGKLWSSMVMASFSRDRKYANYRYEPTEEILQKKIGSEWGAKTILWTFTRKF